MINPAFIPYPQEASLLGAMVIGYGELDISFAHVVGIVLGQQFAVLEACHAVRSEGARLDIANALGIEAFSRVGLAEEYTHAHDSIRYCLKVRNLYAHSQWADLGGQLALTNAEKTFTRPPKKVEWTMLTLQHLQTQEAFFENTRAWLIWLELTLGERGKRRPATWNKPPKMQRPPLYSPIATPRAHKAQASPSKP